MWLGSQAAVAIVQAHSLSSDLTPSLGTSKCHRCSPKKTKKKKKEKIKIAKRGGGCSNYRG